MRVSRSLFRPRKPARAGRPTWKCAEEFKRYLRKLPCPACGQEPGSESNPIVSAHVDHAGKGTPDAKGASSKVADRWCIPLCNDCHRIQTDVVGWPEFEMRLPLGDAAALAAVYWTEFPGRQAWERQFADEEATASDNRVRA